MSQRTAMIAGEVAEKTRGRFDWRLFPSVPLHSNRLFFPRTECTLYQAKTAMLSHSKPPCIVCILVLPSLYRLNGPENLGDMSGTVRTGAMMLGMVTIAMSATATGSLGCEFLRA